MICRIARLANDLTLEPSGLARVLSVVARWGAKEWPLETAVIVLSASLGMLTHAKTLVATWPAIVRRIVGLDVSGVMARMQ